MSLGPLGQRRPHGAVGVVSASPLHSYRCGVGAAQTPGSEKESANDFKLNLPSEEVTEGRLHLGLYQSHLVLFDENFDVINT